MCFTGFQKNSKKKIQKKTDKNLGTTKAKSKRTQSKRIKEWTPLKRDMEGANSETWPQKK
jgi:hypothetical protein